MKKHRKSIEITINNFQRQIKIAPRIVIKIINNSVKELFDKNGEIKTCFVFRDKYLIIDPSNIELSVIFVSDKKMKEFNLQYRGKDKSTDVLSFCQIEDTNKKIYIFKNSPVVIGDIVISPNQAKQQSIEQGYTFYQSLSRLLIHGLLHLLGYDHEKNSYQKKRMQKLEDAIFNSFS